MIGCGGFWFILNLIATNVRCFTFGLRSVGLWVGQTDVKAFVSFSILNFFSEGINN